jgi:uncharacterized protein
VKKTIYKLRSKIMKIFFASFLLLLSSAVFSQKGYEDSLHAFLNNYVQTHEVVKGENRKAMQFFPVSKTNRVVAHFEKAADSKWLKFPTSGKSTQTYRVYGTLHFQMAGKPLQLMIYQSQDLLSAEAYKHYLFLPFTDSTTGSETYEGGRYIDLSTTDIQNNMVVIDFNKAYNPYCAYVSGKYNCPIPPKENALPVAIRAGEKAYGKAH